MHAATRAMIREVESKNEVTIEIPPGFIVFCDMDGTLIDTDYANYLSYRYAVIEATCGKHVIEFTRERLNRESLKNRLPSLTAEQYEVIAYLKAEFFTKFLSETKLNVALANLITKFSKTNETVLVTCCRNKRAMETLRYHNLLGCFSRFICWEDLPQGESTNKYENALGIIGANPEAVIVFENDIGDVEKALRAGVPKENVISIFARTEVETS
jgi:beta-phosphoglucomutase-like phosphatase (HAD superfamily)